MAIIAPDGRLFFIEIGPGVRCRVAGKLGRDGAPICVRGVPLELGATAPAPVRFGTCQAQRGRFMVHKM
jgi:hypothetical protein